MKQNEYKNDFGLKDDKINEETCKTFSVQKFFLKCM